MLMLSHLVFHFSTFKIKFSIAYFSRTNIGVSPYFDVHRCWWRILETQIVTNIAVSPYFFQFYTDNLTDSLAEACDCLSVLQLPPETKIIDQQLPDIVFQTCRGLGKAYIDRQMLKQYDRS